MYLKRSIYLLSILITLLSQQGLAQSFEEIGGIINEYAAIESIYSLENNDVDSVVVDDLFGFTVNDTVMIYCTRGSRIVEDTVDGGAFDEFDDIGSDSLNPGNNGRYAFLIIDEIYEPDRVIVFNNKITPHIKAMRNGDLFQLIRVPSYRNAEVSSTLLADAWNGTTGGVVTLFANVLKLSADIDVTGNGFRGAAESEDYLYGCTSENMTGLDSLFFHIDHFGAGLKGEGTTGTYFNRMRGRAKNINGGGGGNGLFSGGGGGANYSGGGRGGNESDQCDLGLQEPGGQGGFSLYLNDYFTNYYNDFPINFDKYDRISFGGGGGTGTRKSGIIPSDGGNGGGLIVIVADSIIGNDNFIRADGSNAQDSQGAAGGGGGGGAIVLDVNGYRTQLNLSAKGGNGGNTNGSDVSGPGGGGGGGVYWISGFSGDHSNIGRNNDQGLPGLHDPNIDHGAGVGGRPGEKYELYAPIRGFIFNPVPTEFEVCSDQIPEDLVASEPKGGDGPGSYTYLWVDSSSTQNSWEPAPEGPGKPNDNIIYQFPGPLAQTTYYRRIVNPDSILSNTSFRIAVYVDQAIENNTISAPDTVCYEEAPGLFEPSIAIGGGRGPGTYFYQWQKDEGTGFIPAEGLITDSIYQAPGLITSTYFNRITTSGACIDTSDALFVQVWDKLEDYQITDYDTVCYNERLPHELSSFTGLPPLNGDTLDIRYQWITSPDTINWTDIPGATSETYQPPLQTQTTYYSRIVLSGSDNACVETARHVEILNINLIENNTIADTRTVCTGDDGGEFSGSVPTGGLDDLQFSYTWQSRTQSTGWITEDSSTEVRVYNPGLMDGDTTWYRRMVGAGGVSRDVCISYSNVDTIHVLPPITNNLITTLDNVKCEDDFLEWLTQDSTNGSIPIGGDATWVYQWQVATGSDLSDSWADIDGATNRDYSSQPILDGDLDRWYRRHVYSGPENQCQDFSDTIHIAVHTGITGNTIDAVDSTCFYALKEVLGALPLGEDGLVPGYTWRDAISGADLPGIQGQNYSDTFRVQQLYQFQREVQIGACTDTSNTMRVTVMELPGGVLTGDISQSCESDVMLDVALRTDGLENYILPWSVSLGNGVNDNLDGPYPLNADGEVEVTLSTDSDSTQFTYSIAEISYTSLTGRYECVSPTNQLSGEVPIMVFRTPDPEITVDGEARESYKKCGTTVELEAIADRGNGLWTFDPFNYISVSPSAGDGYLISIPNSTEAYGVYKATFTSTAGVCSGADSIDLYYYEQPEKPDVGADTVLFLINEVVLKASEPTAGYGEWTVNPSGPIIEDKDSPQTTARNMDLNAENIFTWTVRNGEDEGECIDTADFKVVTRTEVKRYQGFSPNGDMDNEYFIMQGLMYADEYEVIFFNSLGNTVRTVTNENIDEVDYDPNLILNQREDELVVWDGKSENGTLVPNGTYYYVVHYIKDGVDYPYQDYVVVLKE